MLKSFDLEYSVSAHVPYPEAKVTGQTVSTCLEHESGLQLLTLVTYSLLFQNNLAEAEPQGVALLEHDQTCTLCEFSCFPTFARMHEPRL